MPTEGYKSVTISEDVYKLVKKFYQKKKGYLRLKRIRSMSQLVEDILLEYIEKNYPEEYKKLLEELEKEG